MMGSYFCKKKIKVVHKFPKDKKYDNISPIDKIILSYNELFEVLSFEIKFYGFY